MAIVIIGVVSFLAGLIVGGLIDFSLVVKYRKQLEKFRNSNAEQLRLLVEQNKKLLEYEQTINKTWLIFLWFHSNLHH